MKEYNETFKHIISQRVSVKFYKLGFELRIRTTQAHFLKLCSYKKNGVAVRE